MLVSLLIINRCYHSNNPDTSAFARVHIKANLVEYIEYIDDGFYALTDRAKHRKTPRSRRIYRQQGAII